MSAQVKIQAELQALNLSEDLNRVATGDDELILLVYLDSPRQEIPRLLYQKVFKADSLHRNFQFEIPDSFPFPQRLCWVLLEMDTEKLMVQIEPVIRLNLDILAKTGLEGDLDTLHTLLGDDDLLGITRMSFPATVPREKSILIHWEGLHLFDAYHYQLRVYNQ